MYITIAPLNMQVKYRLLFICCLLTTMLHAQAEQTGTIFKQANEHYAKAYYEEAIILYQRILNDNVESPELHYNLGNAYYKMDSIGLAILHYEKAKKLLPNDDDIETNLALANLKTEDKIEAMPAFFLSDWWRMITLLFSEKIWSWWLIVSLVSSLFLWALYISTAVVIRKKIFFYSAFISTLLAVVIFFMARASYSRVVDSGEAIVVVPVSDVKSAPQDNAAKLFLLHEGSKITITDQDNDWLELRLSNGNVGWIKGKDVKKI